MRVLLRGAGDTLTGMLLACLSSYHHVKHSVANAVYLHGASADYYSKEKAAASMLASDVSENLAFVMKEFE
jgi:ADP-dependent NAD(P)H-hydrate dehydratase / NAD(P)H-hydrate epimerase